MNRAKVIERNNLHGGQNLLKKNKQKQKLYEALNLNPKYLTTTERNNKSC